MSRPRPSEAEPSRDPVFWTWRNDQSEAPFASGGARGGTRGWSLRYDLESATITATQALASATLRWTNNGTGLLTVEETLRFEAAESGAWQPPPACLLADARARADACARAEVPVMLDGRLALDAARLIPGEARHEAAVVVSGRVRLLVPPGRTRCARIVGTLSAVRVAFAAADVAGDPPGGYYLGTVSHDWLIEDWDFQACNRLSVMRPAASVRRTHRPASARRA